MSDSRTTEGLVNAYLANLPTPNGTEVDGKVLTDALTTMQQTKSERAADTSRITWRTIMTNKASKLAIATVIVAVVLSLTVFDGLTKPTWAWEDAIKALKDFRAVYVVGAFPGGTAEVWMRANKAKTQSADVVVKGSLGAITWTQDGSTYHYEPGQNTVYYEPALTIGISQWLGPELLEMLSAADNAQTVRGKDPATGRDRVMLLCSLIDVHGAQSWNIEFDVASKLPISFKQWPNLDRSGPPAFDAFKVTYYEDLPDSVFDVDVPAQAKYVEKPLTIPDENIGILSDSSCGISAEGMSQEQAAQQAVRVLYQAVIDQDIEKLKQICPLAAMWGDALVRAVIFKPDQDDRIVEIVGVGPICRTGHSKLGPLVAVPTTVRLKNGKKVEEKMVVQFRTLGGQSSCVIHGPYGLPRGVE